MDPSFIAALHATLSSNNAERNAAEEYLANLKSDTVRYILSSFFI